METGTARRVEQAVAGGAIAADAALVRGILPPRNPMAHKGDFGRVHIVGGCLGYAGAPVLAARAALRCGAGLVSLSVPASVYSVAAGRCPEAMTFPLPVDRTGGLSRGAISRARRASEGKSACLVGPGLGRSPMAQLLVCRLAAAADCPLVLDADGLNAVSAHIDKLDGRRGRTTVLTPHEGEFARLGGDLSRADRLRAARELAAAHGCVVVLKGPATVTALPDGHAWVNTTGNCGMATGGSGDVLSGMVLSLLGLGLEAGRAAAAAVWLHGRAGDLAAAEKGTWGMTPLDLIAKIPDALREVTD